MRVIITGGTGFIGRALAQSLAADAHEVILLSRNPAKQKDPIPGTRAVQWDGRTAAGWGELASGAGAIVNLAGESLMQLWTKSARKRILESRVKAGQAVSEAVAAAAVKPGVLIQSSAVGYYGSRKDEIVTESSSPGTDFLARVVWEWENATASVARAGVRRAVIRTGLPLSPNGGVFPLLALPFKLVIAGGPLGSGRQYYPWLHLEDEVSAIRFLIDNLQAKGPFNLSSPNPVTQKEMAKVLGQVLGRPSILPVPAFAMKAVMGDLSSLVLTGQRVIPQRLLDLGFTFKWPDLIPALRALLNK